MSRYRAYTVPGQTSTCVLDGAVVVAECAEEADARRISHLLSEDEKRRLRPLGKTALYVYQRIRAALEAGGNPPTYDQIARSQKVSKSLVAKVVTDLCDRGKLIRTGTSRQGGRLSLPKVEP